MVSNELSKYIVWMQIVAVVLYDQMEWSLETVHNVEGLSFDSLISLDWMATQKWEIYIQ